MCSIDRPYVNGATPPRSSLAWNGTNWSGHDPRFPAFRSIPNTPSIFHLYVLARAVLIWKHLQDPFLAPLDGKPRLLIAIVPRIIVRILCLYAQVSIAYAHATFPCHVMCSTNLVQLYFLLIVRNIVLDGAMDVVFSRRTETDARDHVRLLCPDGHMWRA